MAHLRWHTAGESHGPELVAWIEGCPAGVPLLASQVDEELARRQKGYGRGGRMKIETDRCRLVAGVRGGETLGSPIALLIENRDFASWTGRMGAEPFASPPEALTRARPGHADLAGGLKYARKDLRDILERASARETAARVGASVVARRLLEEVGIRVAAHVVSIGEIAISRRALSFDELRTAARASDLASIDPDAELAWRDAIHAASHAGDTLGGVVEVVTDGVPPGLGSHVTWDRKLDGRLAQALMSVPVLIRLRFSKMGFTQAPLYPLTLSIFKVFITKILLLNPTCGDAKPIPFFNSINSNILTHCFFISVVTLVTGRHFCSKISLGARISSTRFFLNFEISV